jgi:integrase/recombinase XerD
MGQRHDPQSFAALLPGFVEWLQVHNYSPQTLRSRRHALGIFFNWAHERGITQPPQVTRAILERYQRWICHYRTAEGKPLAMYSQSNYLAAVLVFFRWCTRQNHTPYNPASELELPRREVRLPRGVLSAAEVERVFKGIDVMEPRGLRDRAILETLYSTGMRRAELAALKLCDLDMERGTVMVRLGKGRKDRMIPIGERALAWIAKYLEEVRPRLAWEPDEGIVFLTYSGGPFSLTVLSEMAREHIDAAELGKSGSCHLFRHTMATLMLENGADIRFIQAMLGHAALTTTQIYTQVSISKLKEIHARTHPAKLHKAAPQALPPASASG